MHLHEPNSVCKTFILYNPIFNNEIKNQIYNEFQMELRTTDNRATAVG
jgi:hypothetical protein